jgi:hypothetical protein
MIRSPLWLGICCGECFAFVYLDLSQWMRVFVLIVAMLAAAAAFSNDRGRPNAE